ncbi:MAG: CoA pyrophosphatase [Anaerolineales bacterium]|nr:CoA pyrophosphatase [Anaerolineales bacterium]
MIHPNLPEVLRSRLHPPDHCSQSTDGERCAAVLLALWDESEKWHLLLTRRTKTVREHKGQVAFPGGAVEENDRTRTDTALREAHEEIGLCPDDATVLGCLSPCSTVTGWHITPVVAIIPQAYPFQFNCREIEAIFPVPLKWLANPKNLTKHPYTDPRDGTTQSAFYFLPYDRHVIWGASARITLALLEKAEMR